MINVPSARLTETNMHLLKWYVSQKDYGIVYVTVNNPFFDLVKEFKKAGIDMSRIFFIEVNYGKIYKHM